MSRRTTRLLLALLAIYLAASAGLGAYRFFDRRAIFHEVAQAREAALSSTSAATTPDDARRWLERNGFRVVFWNPHDRRGFITTQMSSVDGEHHIVMGQRRIRDGNWLVWRTWIDITFRFTLGGEFFDVKARSSWLEIGAPDSSSVLEDRTIARWDSSGDE